MAGNTFSAVDSALAYGNAIVERWRGGNVPEDWKREGEGADE